jgi:hypothetical protein
MALDALGYFVAVQVENIPSFHFGQRIQFVLAQVVQPGEEHIFPIDEPPLVAVYPEDERRHAGDERQCAPQPPIAQQPQQRRRRERRYRPHAGGERTLCRRARHARDQRFEVAHLLGQLLLALLAFAVAGSRALFAGQHAFRF